jgi:hypothetical protein
MLDYQAGIRCLWASPEVADEIYMTLCSEHYYGSDWAGPAEMADPEREAALAGLELYIRYFKRHAGIKEDSIIPDEWFE